MALLKCKKNSHSIIVSFGSDTTVRFASRLKSGLLSILQEPVEHYRLDLSEITDTDITFIQVLISFGLSLERQERRLSIIRCAESSPFMRVCDLCGINIRSILEFEG